MKKFILLFIVCTSVNLSAAPKMTNTHPPIKRPSPMKETPLIVIDAGHGGKDLGANSKKAPKYEEKVLTLKTASLVNQNLKQLGYRTMMTREDDTFIELSERATKANSANATLFVSVHYNSAAKPSANGIEVFYYQPKESNTRSDLSKKLADSLVSETVRMTHARSRGIKHGNFAVIRETKIPAALIEAGFLTNAQESQNIQDPAYMKSIAWGIARGVDEFLKGNKNAAKVSRH